MSGFTAFPLSLLRTNAHDDSSGECGEFLAAPDNDGDNVGLDDLAGGWGGCEHCDVSSLEATRFERCDASSLEAARFEGRFLFLRGMVERGFRSRRRSSVAAAETMFRQKVWS